MAKPVLIVYTSRYGSTRESVKALAASIRGPVDVVELGRDKVASLDPYQVVIIGGPVFAGKVHPRLRRFCKTWQTELSSRKVGLFVAALARYERAMEYMAMSFPSWLIDQSFCRETFGGNLDLTRTSLWHRFLLKRFAGIKWSRNHLNPAAIDRMATAVNSRLGI